jgi:hypothetical protein
MEAATAATKDTTRTLDSNTTPILAGRVAGCALAGLERRAHRTGSGAPELSTGLPGGHLELGLDLDPRMMTGILVRGPDR